MITSYFRRSGGPFKKKNFIILILVGMVDDSTLNSNLDVTTHHPYKM